MEKNKRTGRLNRRKGRFAEFVARFYFMLKGWKILHKNYVTGKGTLASEIDFIALRRNVLVFVEVKERQTLALAAEAVAGRQKRRLINAAKYFLAKYPIYQNCNIRFDVVLFNFPWKIVHITNAWEE